MGAQESVMTARVMAVSPMPGRRPIGFEWKQRPVRQPVIRQKTPTGNSLRTSAVRRLGVSLVASVVDVAPLGTGNLASMTVDALDPAGGSLTLQPATSLGRTKSRRRSRQLIIELLILVVVAVGLFIAYDTWRQNRIVERVVQASVQYDESVVTPEQKSRYVVPGAMPRLLVIEAIGLESRMRPVGLDKDGRIDVPAHIDDVGWYEGGTHPGEPGVAFVGGHVTGNTRAGIFSELHILKVGAEIKIQRGDGTWLTYEVEQVEKKPARSIDIGHLLQGDRADKKLVLMTCAGTYRPEIQQYDERVIISAKQLSD